MRHAEGDKHKELSATITASSQTKFADLFTHSGHSAVSLQAKSTCWSLSHADQVSQPKTL